MRLHENEENFCTEVAIDGICPLSIRRLSNY